MSRSLKFGFPMKYLRYFLFKNLKNVREDVNRCELH